MPNEILWGQRFQHTTVAYDKEASKFGITYSTIDAIEDDSTPRWVNHPIAICLKGIFSELLSMQIDLLHPLGLTTKISFNIKEACSVRKIYLAYKYCKYVTKSHPTRFGKVDNISNKYYC